MDTSVQHAQASAKIPPQEDTADRLLSHHRDLLHARAISDEIILERGYESYMGPALLLEREKRWSKGQQKQSLFPALAYPVRSCGNADPANYVMRPDHPRKPVSDSGKERVLKYEVPPRAPQVLDVLPRFEEALGDPAKDLWITEGSLKSDALASAGAPVAASINGVYGWRGSNDKGGKLIIPDLERVALNDRTVPLAFDSDMVRNANVMQAARRFGNYLATKGAKVMVLMLPQIGDGKVGVDDFLASLPPEERSIDALKPYLVPFEEGTRTFTDRFGKTPEGLELLNPPGYQNRQDSLTYTNPQTGQLKTVYNGYIAVTALGRDLATGEATLTVTWRDGEVRNGARNKSVTAPQAELATAKGVIRTLSARGATVHEKNSKDLSEFLLEFARVNNQALKTEITTDHYGYNGVGIVGPGWSVGEAVRYEGSAPLSIKPDGAETYKQAVRDALKWSAPPLLLALGLATVSPHLERLETVRNPVLWLSGESNYGKTTLGEFAVSLYAKPRDVSIQTGRSTWAGFTQRLAYLRGLPVLLDESQTADASRLQNVIYQHANGQTYAKGGVDGQPQGNTPLHGAVIVLGESAPELTFKGARNRILDLRAAKHLPLGIGPNDTPEGYMPDGARRAAILRDAVSAGAGSLGEAVTRAIWNDWEGFEERVAAHQRLITSCEAAEWVRPLAAAAAGLEYLLDVCDVPPIDRPSNLVQWAHEVLCASRAEHDVALNAFEELRALVLNAPCDYSEANVRTLRGERVAHSRETDYLVVQTSEPVKRLLEPFGGLQGLGSQWVRRGWVTPGTDGKTTSGHRIDGSQRRLLAIPRSIMDNGVS